MRNLLCAVLLTSATAAQAQQAVDDALLAQVRGGFELTNGLLVSLGVERLVSINGTVVASTHFSIPDMTQLSAAQAQAATDAMAAVLVRNSRNDQAIRSQTTISTTVANLTLLKALNFEGGLRAALAGAVGK
ncbi:hypothetical protein [Duganella sp.]|uniref:hypothetical protein n=1 Tax=Duganella sp. TaxID=1904440 RepID=UPI0031CFB45A